MDELRRRHMAGYALAATSAVTFSAKGIVAKIIYGYGVDPVTLLAIRFIVAMPLFWATLLLFPSEKASRTDVVILVLSGLLGHYAAATADFYGLLYIDATLERIILYTYPAFVVVLTTLIFKEPMTRRRVLSVVLTYAGLALALRVWEISVDVRLLGALLVLFSAVIYSLSYILTQVLGKRVSGVKISTYMTTASTFAFVATWHGSSFPHGGASLWAYIILLAVVCTYVPLLTATLGIMRIGASRSALVSFLGPVSTAVLAAWILGESLEAVQIAGMVLIFAGILVIYSGKTGKQPEGA